jgi:hypothetical protein
LAQNSPQLLPTKSVTGIVLHRHLQPVGQRRIVGACAAHVLLRDLGIVLGGVSEYWTLPSLSTQR